MGLTHGFLASFRGDFLAAALRHFEINAIFLKRVRILSQALNLHFAIERHNGVRIIRKSSFCDRN